MTRTEAEAETGPGNGLGIRAAGRAALCAVALLALHTVGGYCVLVAVLTTSEGPWDTSVTRVARAMAAAGIVIELVAVAATASCTRRGWLRRWWFALPTALIAVALARVVFAPVP